MVLRLLVGLLFLTPTSAFALDYNAGDFQFAGGFSPSNAPHGGFGGGNCVATRTPVIYLHGNADVAANWDFPSSTGVASAYDTFKAAGYNDCELFGLNYLSPTERTLPQFNYHTPGLADTIRDFILDVRAYTGSSQVDIIGHSLGVTVGLHGIDYGNLWSSIRRFISIAGAMRGLESCRFTGYANPAAPTCGSQNFFNSNIFGLHPSVWYASNPRMANGGFRDRPAGQSARFYTISAGSRDQFLCPLGVASSCSNTARFDSWSSVRAQLNVGYGSLPTPTNAGGDTDGVGHFRAKNNTGEIQVDMLTTSCTGTSCCSSYTDVCQ
ncbi:MAG: lipase [Myxococcota bacterium]